jgi:hypothetical protein
MNSETVTSDPMTSDPMTSDPMTSDPMTSDTERINDDLSLPSGRPGCPGHDTTGR